MLIRVIMLVNVRTEVLTNKKIVEKRLKVLWEGVYLLRAKLTAMFEVVDRRSIYRYKNGTIFPFFKVPIHYYDYFDMPLDYIFGRTDNRQGKLCEFQPQVFKDNKQIQELIEMCFHPNSPANSKLKGILLRLLETKNSLKELESSNLKQCDQPTKYKFKSSIVY